MPRLLEYEGFSVLRVRGSHRFLTRGDTDTVVPGHGNRPLKIGTLRKILRDIGLTPEFSLSDTVALRVRFLYTLGDFTGFEAGGGLAIEL